MQIWVNSVVQEATDRDHLITRTFDDFLLLRRQTGGVMPCFAMIGLGMDLPDSVIKHPAIVALTTHAIDMVILSNVSQIVRPTSLHNLMNSRTSILTTSNKPAVITTT